jgi:hypothetical protein
VYRGLKNTYIASNFKCPEKVTSVFLVFVFLYFTQEKAFYIQLIFVNFVFFFGVVKFYVQVKLPNLKRNCPQALNLIFTLDQEEFQIL